MDNTAYYVLGVFNSSDTGDTDLRVEPVVAADKLQELRVGRVAKLMEKRGLHFGVAKNIELAFGHTRGQVPREHIERKRHDDRKREIELEQEVGERDRRLKLQKDFPEIEVETDSQQWDAAPAPTLPLGKLGHVSREEALGMAVPHAVLTREQRAKAREANARYDGVKVGYFFNAREGMRMDLRPNQAQSMVMRVPDLDDPKAAYPVQVRYTRGDGGGDPLIDEFVILFVPRAKAHP